MVQLSHLYMITGKTITLTIRTFVSKVMSLLYNTLSRFVKVFLLRSKSLLTLWPQSLWEVILEPRKTKSVSVFTFLSFLYWPWSDGTRCHDLLNVEFQASFFTLLFHLFIKRLFSSYSLSTIRVVSSAFLRLLFLPEILIPACDLCSLAFHMMYSAYKLNKQGDNIQPCHTPFIILNPSVVPCPVLTVASWPKYRFLRRQAKWSDIPTSLRTSSLLWSTQSKAST